LGWVTTHVGVTAHLGKAPVNGQGQEPSIHQELEKFDAAIGCGGTGAGELASREEGLLGVTDRSRGGGSDMEALGVFDQEDEGDPPISRLGVLIEAIEEHEEIGPSVCGRLKVSSGP
jgi:hypothetical protein